MALKTIIKSLDEVSEELRSVYRQEGDVFVLDFEKDDIIEHPAARALKNALDGEREARAKAREEAAELSSQIAKYKDIDPEKARDALKKLQDLEDKNLIDEGKIDELLSQRTERMRVDFETNKTALEKARDEAIGERDQYRDKLIKEVVDNKIMQTAAEKGVRKGAMPDVLGRARTIWKLDEQGNPVAYDGERQMFGKSGSDPLTMGEWMDGLASEAEHLFEPNRGGDARGGDGGNEGVRTVSQENAGNFLKEIAEGEAVIAN